MGPSLALRRPSQSEALVEHARGLLGRAVDASGVAIVLVLVGRASARTLSRAAVHLREDDALVLVAPGVVAACAPVRPGSGVEAFRERTATSLLGASPGEELRRRSVVVQLQPGEATSIERRVAVALDELLARPRRRPSLRSSLRRRSRSELVADATLGQLAIRGGGYLLAREALGMAVRLGGVVLTVREIGPADYGLYSAAAAFVLLVTAVAQMGVEVYLIRQPGDLDRRHLDVAFSFLLVTSLTLTAAAIGLTYAVGGVLRPAGVVAPLRVLLLSVPLNVLWAPAQATIERQFRYRTIGLLELGGDLVLYLTAIPLAVLHAGAWSLVAGFMAMQGWLLVGSYAVSGIRPRLAWSRRVARDLLHHGLTYSLTLWASGLQGLVNPLVVGSFAGAAGVGFVAFAQRLVATLSFARRGAYRLGMVAMGRVSSGERARLRYAIEEGTVLQLVALAATFAVFGLFARELVPALFGGAWARVIPLYVLLSVAGVLGSATLVQTTFLFSRGRNAPVAGATAVSTTLLAVTAALAVPRLGIDGFGVAVLVALAGLAVLDRAVRQEVHFSYRRTLAAAGVTVPLLLVPVLGAPWSLVLLAPLCGAALTPAFRAEVGRLYRLLRSALGRRSAGSGTGGRRLGRVAS